jgi:hypothetical protein
LSALERALNHDEVWNNKDERDFNIAMQPLSIKQKFFLSSLFMPDPPGSLLTMLRAKVLMIVRKRRGKALASELDSCP